MTTGLPTVAASVDDAGATEVLTSDGMRLGLGVAAALRGGLSLLAIPVAPLLFRRHFLALVLLRPTKEVLLAAGFRLRAGDVPLHGIYLAALPMAVGGVWLFYWLGRAFAPELEGGVELPRLARRVLPPERIERLRRVLEEKGTKVVFFGRLAVFPSSLLAAAAGASGQDARSFLLADGLGALAAITEVVVAGYVLGEAYERAGLWLAVVGSVVALGLLVALGRWLRADSSSRRGA